MKRETHESNKIKKFDSNIADELEETPESIQILYDCVKEHLQQDNEDIYDIYKNMK